MNLIVKNINEEEIPSFLSQAKVPFRVSSVDNSSLEFDRGKLSYRLGHQDGLVSFDFLQYERNWSKSKPSKNKELFGRAIGLKPGSQIVDLSCGTGKDTSLLLYWGYCVTAFERNPIIYLLLFDAYRRALEDASWSNRYKDHFQLIFDEGVNYKNYVKADAIYFDPMFDELKKVKSLPRKEMVLFKHLINEKSDGVEVAKSLIAPETRLILKRPIRDREFEELSPLEWRGKSIKYLRLGGGC